MTEKPDITAYSNKTLGELLDLIVVYHNNIEGSRNLRDLCIRIARKKYKAGATLIANYVGLKRQAIYDVWKGGERT